MALRRPTLVVTALTVALAAFALTGASAAAGSVACDRVAATTGSDSAAGTEAAPFRSASKLVDSLASGQTGCFRAGTYNWSGDLSIHTASITVTSYPGELATLQGRLRIERTATAAVVEGLVLNGRNSNNHLSPVVYADSAVLRGNEITNEKTAICVHVTKFYDEPAPRDVVIEGNRIHDCGEVGTNQQHGVYLANARDTVIRDNWIYRNADRGIQLYPNADRTQITGNVIDSNGQGIIFSGSSSQASDDNLVEGNVITSSTIRHNLESGSGLAGTGNVARGNCVWTTRSDYRGSPDGSGIEPTQKSFSAHDNVVDDPQFVDPAAGDYRLKTGSPCTDVLSGSAAERDVNPSETISPETSSPDTSIDLTVNRHKVRPRQRLRLRGQVHGATRSGERAVILVRRNGGWRRFGRARVRAGNRFASRIRIRPRSRKRLRLRAAVRGVGRSRAVRLRVRR